jgi:hypothetical protein
MFPEFSHIKITMLPVQVRGVKFIGVHRQCAICEGSWKRFRQVHMPESAVKWKHVDSAHCSVSV